MRDSKFFESPDVCSEIHACRIDPMIVAMSWDYDTGDSLECACGNEIACRTIGRVLLDSLHIVKDLWIVDPRTADNAYFDCHTHEIPESH